MRVLFWTPEFWPGIGGVEVLAAKLLPALRERGYEFIVVTPSKPTGVPDKEYYKGIPVYRFPFRSAENYTDASRLLDLRQRIAKLKKAFAPDLIHLNSLDVGGDFFHMTTAQAYPCSSLVSLHVDWPRLAGKGNCLAEQMLRCAGWVAACSAAMLRTAREAVPEIISKSSVVYNGREIPTIQPDPVSFDPPVVLCIGRLADEKGFDLALRAFASVIHRLPKARLMIAGDGPARPTLEQLTAKLGLGGAVKFVGWVEPDGVAKVLNSSTLVVVPSRWEEPFGLVALEAALMGRAVLATRVGGLPEVVLDQQTGILVEKENSDALAEAIIYLLEHPAVAVSMGRAGMRRAREVFAWTRFVEAHDTLYRKLMSEGNTDLSSSSHWS
jgi:glycosyltransferase involved in cell wall biosynthesis